VRHGTGEFDRQTFLANIESIWKKTFSEGNVKSAFRKCRFVPFRLALVLRQISVNEAALADRIEHWQEDQVDSDLQEIWSSPNTHTKLYQQAGAIQDMLRSSVEPPDTPTRLRNHTNVNTFMQNILAKDLVHKQLQIICGTPPCCADSARAS
jgi:hypothetical protein